MALLLASVATTAAMANGVSSQRASVYYPSFSEKLPSMAGKAIAITGCSRGLGFVTALTLAQKGARLYLLNRNSAAAESALSELTQACAACGAPAPQHIECNLLDFASVRKAAAAVQEILAEEQQCLDVLCLNAGIMLQEDTASKDGFDITISTNVLSHFLLARELLPALEAAATAPGRGEARIVSMSSGSAYGRPGFDASFFAPDSGGRLGGLQQAGARYHQSKLGNLLFTSAIDRKLRGRGSKVKALACTPGVCATDMFVHVQENFFNPGKPADLSTVPSVEDGCLGQLQCICDPSVESGTCWGPKGMAGPPERITLAPPMILVDEASEAAFWDACERAVGAFAV